MCLFLLEFLSKNIIFNVCIWQNMKSQFSHLPHIHQPTWSYPCPFTLFQANVDIERKKINLNAQSLCLLLNRTINYFKHSKTQNKWILHSYWNLYLKPIVNSSCFPSQGRSTDVVMLWYGILYIHVLLCPQGYHLHLLRFILTLRKCSVLQWQYDTLIDGILHLHCTSHILFCTASNGKFQM